MVARVGVLGIALLFGVACSQTAVDEMKGTGGAPAPGDGKGGAPAAPGDGGGSPLPVVQVRATLADGSTNIGQGPLVATFTSLGRMLDAATVARLAGRLALRTWPEGEAVATTTSTQVAADGKMATATLTPDAPLPDRWLALNFGPPETGLVTSQTFDGEWGVRLRPGSHPMVARITFCSASSPGAKVIAYFSEPVTIADPAAAFTVEQGGIVLDCPVTDSQSTELHEFCGTLVDGPVAIGLAAGQVRGTSGATLDPQRWMVDLAQLSTLANPCRDLHPPLSQS